MSVTTTSTTLQPPTNIDGWMARGVETFPEWDPTNRGEIHPILQSGSPCRRPWISIASSSDGTKLVASESDGVSYIPYPRGTIYTSSDSGATWTPRISDQIWMGVASSSDGTKLVALSYRAPNRIDGGQIYTSTDSGVSWTPRETNRKWTNVASSSDGTKLVATVERGQIYTSTDSGVSWTPRETNRKWTSVASSSDGTKLVATVVRTGGPDVGTGGIYSSNDSGVSWTQIFVSDLNWKSIASSSDGTKLIASTGNDLNINGYIYISDDSGVNWIKMESGEYLPGTISFAGQDWSGVASSSDGAKLVAVARGGKIYTSDNRGVIWREQESNRSWGVVASNSDGTKLVVLDSSNSWPNPAGGFIYTNYGELDDPRPCPDPNPNDEPTTTTTDNVDYSPCLQAGFCTANWGGAATWNGSPVLGDIILGNLTTVGSNGGPSYYGTYDQDGNVAEWNDLGGYAERGNFYFPPRDPERFTIVRGIRGRGFEFNASISPKGRDESTPGRAKYNVGFRIASLNNPLDLNLVSVGDAGNSPHLVNDDGDGFGRVDYEYKIGKYVVTNCEYVDFLNSVDPEGLQPDNIYMFDTWQGTVPAEGEFVPLDYQTFIQGYWKGIDFNPNNPNGNKYTIRPNMSNKPVTYITWFSCARYCNWLHNGKRVFRTTSDSNDARNFGAYNIGPARPYEWEELPVWVPYPEPGTLGPGPFGDGDFTTPETATVVPKEPTAKYYIPTEDEWYKAAYYKGMPELVLVPSTTGGLYWENATQSNAIFKISGANSKGDGPYSSDDSNYDCPPPSNLCSDNDLVSLAYAKLIFGEFSWACCR